MSDHEFWAQDMTSVHEKKSWFGRLSTQRKVMFVLILLFVVSWCFLLGMQIAKADDPAPEDWHIATKDDLGDKQLLGELLNIDGLRTILLIGCDEREGYEVGRSDTMMLAFINGDNNQISLLSIPRDCYVQIPGYSTKTKINHSYAYGGASLTISTIEYFLGIKIDDYVEVDFKGFVEVVDALGGVDINVDQRMINYDEGINLNPGMQTLDGKQALGYCRFRIGQDGTSSISDVTRAQHQQNFIIALKDKLLSLSTIWKIPKLVTLANANVTTSISTSDAIKLGNTLLNMGLENIKTYVIPTHSMWINSISYEIVDAPGTRVILDEIIGDEYEYSPNIIDDGGAGRYQAGGDAQPEGDDTPPDLDSGDNSDSVDDGSVDDGSDANNNGGNTDEGNSGDDGGSQTGGVEDIPEPGE